MKTRILALGIAMLLPLAAASSEPEQVVLCLNRGGIPGGVLLPTQQLLEGKTVKVFYYLENHYYPNFKVEDEPVVQTF